MAATPWSRRAFLRLGVSALAAPGLLAARRSHGAEHAGRIYKALKFTMVAGEAPLLDKFRMLREAGFEGVELDSPGGPDKQEAIQASESTALAIPGIIDSIHWNVRLSDPDPAVRARALEGLKTALREAKLVGASTVLLVPGKVTDPKHENHEQVWQRSIEQVRKALPLAARLGVVIGIENVWNGFNYDPNQMASYIDQINSPWVGAYFDIGNHRKYGKPEEWIRILGRRIVKLDVKDWGKDNGFCKIGDGDVDWPAVREALADIGYVGWASAEVAGGGPERMKEIAARMDQYLLGV